MSGFIDGIGVRKLYFIDICTEWMWGILIITIWSDWGNAPENSAISNAASINWNDNTHSWVQRQNLWLNVIFIHNNYWFFGNQLDDLFRVLCFQMKAKCKQREINVNDDDDMHGAWALWLDECSHNLYVSRCTVWEWLCSSRWNFANQMTNIAETPSSNAYKRITSQMIHSLSVLFSQTRFNIKWKIRKMKWFELKCDTDVKL